MHGFDSQLGPDEPLGILSALMTRGSVPHALLFTGIPGLGKTTVARHLAMALNCQADPPRTGADGEPEASGPRLGTIPCNHCRSCRKIRSDNHPDITSIQPAGPFIRIDQIRTLCHTLAMKPYEAKFRVVIISDAQTMNPPASNALLKMLEEPPDQTILILTATRAADLLPTIVSRCRQIRFNPLPSAKLAAMLKEKEGIGEDHAAILSTMANGSALRAMALYRAGWIQRRIWLLKQLNSLPDMPLGPLMAMAAKLAQNRETLAHYLEILYTWARDLAVCRVAPEKVICQDVLEQIQRTAEKETAGSVLEKAEAIRAARQDLKANANPRLTMEVLLLRLADAGGMLYDTGS